MENKDLENFNREFENTNFPFKDIFENNESYKKILFDEFVKAEEKPCFELYLNDFHSDGDLGNIFKEINDNIYQFISKEQKIAANFTNCTLSEEHILDLHSEFVNKIIKDELDAKYYCQNIEKTNIIKILRYIQTTINIFQESIFEEQTDIYKEPEIRAESIINSLREIKNEELLIDILNDIMDNEINTFVLVEGMDDIPSRKIYHDWSSMKNTFNTNLEKSISNLKIEEKQNRQKSIPKENVYNGLIFNSQDILSKLYNELKGYFRNKEIDLKKVLDGERLNEKLIFPNNANKFVEVFRRMKYNGFILNNSTEIKNWVCDNFVYQYKKGEAEEIKCFNGDFVYSVLKGDEDPPREKRILMNIDWLPYKTKKELEKEKNKEKNNID